MQNIYDQHPKFNCSFKFIRKLRNRSNLSILRAHSKKRPSLKPEEVTAYRHKLHKLIENGPKDHIINYDLGEFVKCQPVLGIKGSDNVQIYSDVDVKAGFTALAAIGADGRKYPLLFIGKGVSTRCKDSQFGFSNPISDFEPEKEMANENFTAHSPSGWMTTTIWLSDLTYLRALFRIDEQLSERMEPYHLWGRKR